MPYAVHEGVRIHYREEGTGPAVLLVHGFTNNSDAYFARGYVEALKANYHVIVPDMPGRTPSDCPHDVEAYSRERLTGLLVAVLDATDTERAVFWGYSWGDALAYCAAMVAPERFSAWVIGGQPPYGIHEYADVVEPLSQGIEAFIASMEAGGPPMSPERKAGLLRLDAEALVCAAKATTMFTRQPEALARLTAPTLFYVGGADEVYDGMVEAAAAVPSSRFFSLPGLNHGATSANATAVLEHVLPFLSEVTAIPSTPQR